MSPSLSRRGLVLALLALLAACGGGNEDTPADSRVDMGLTLLREGQVEEGLSQLRRAGEDPRLRPEADPPPDWLFPATEHLVRRRRLAEADSLLARMGPVETRPAGLQYIGATVAVMRGREDEALRIYELLGDDPDWGARARFEAGSLHLLRGRGEAALSAARAGLEQLPDDAGLRQLEISALDSLGRHEEALSELRRMPPGPPRWVHEGELLLELGRDGEALEVFQQALQMTPQDPRVRLGIGRALVESDPERAVRALVPLAGPPEPFGDARRQLSRAFRSLGDARAADSLLALAAGDERRAKVDGLRAEGLRHSRDGRLDEALASFDAALALRPDSADLHNDRGAVLGRLGRYEEAERSLLRAEELRPDDRSVQQNLARLYHLMGDSTRRDERLQRLRALADGTGP